MIPVDTCLQCGCTRQQVKDENLVCGILGGYEYREVEVEFDKHHWRDWSNTELSRYGIKPAAYEKYRRASWADLGSLECVDTFSSRSLRGATRPASAVAAGSSSRQLSTSS